MRNRRRTDPVPPRSSLRRSIPWLALADLAREGRDHWTSQLSTRERRRLVELLRSTGGRPSALDERERQELQQLLQQLDLKGLAKRAAVLGAAGSITRKRRGR